MSDRHADRRRPSRSLLRHPDFLKLWTAETVCVFGTQVTQLALPIVAAVILNVTPFEFGLLTTIEFLPFILLSLPAGVWVDRLRRRPILIVGDLGRAIALASIPIAFAARRPDDLAALRRRLRQRLPDGLLRRRLPELPAVDRRARPARGGQLEAGDHAVRVADPGAGLAGVLIGAAAGAVRDAPRRAQLSWSRRSSCSGSGGPEPPVEPHDEATGPKPSMRQEIAVGLRYVTGHRWLRSIAATTGTSNFFGNVGGAILILFLVRERGLHAPSCIGFAFSIGSRRRPRSRRSSTSRLTKRLGVGRMLVLTVVGFSLSGLPVAIAPDSLIFARRRRVRVPGRVLQRRLEHQPGQPPPGDHAAPDAGQDERDDAVHRVGHDPDRRDHRRRPGRHHRPPRDDRGRRDRGLSPSSRSAVAPSAPDRRRVRRSDRLLDRVRQPRARCTRARSTRRSDPAASARARLWSTRHAGAAAGRPLERVRDVDRHGPLRPDALAHSSSIGMWTPRSRAISIACS